MECDLEIEQPVKSGVLRAINFDILSASDAANISAKVVGVVSEVTDPALGLPNSISKCHTCGVQDPKRSSNVTDMRSKRSTKDAKECEGHFGLINLPYTIINPFFLPEVAQILNKICPGCKSVRRSRIKIAASASGQSQWKFCKYCDAKFKSYPPLKFKVSPRNIFKRTAIIAEVNEKLMKKYGLAPDFWDIIPHDAQAEGFSTLVECSKALEENLESNQRFLSHAQVHSILKEVDPLILDTSFKRKSSIFLNCLLLTPNCHRIIEFRQDMLFDERNGLYKKLIDFKGTANELSIRVLDCTKITKLRVANTEATQDTISTASGLKFIKELIIGKRTDNAFRMVVVGDPKLHLNELGVPCYVAENLQVGEQLTPLNAEKLTETCDVIILKKGFVVVRRNGELIRVTALEKLEKGDMVYRPLVDGDVVLINRPPSIHQHSLIALFVKVLPLSSVLSINPLICSPLCGDFDGDCLHGFVPQSIDSKVELQELVSLDKQLTNRQNGRNLLSLSHDSLTAAHLLLEDRVLLDCFQLQQLSMFCNGQGKLPVPAIIKGMSCGSCAWTGKQFFSMFLPGNFDYKFQSDSVCVSQGEVLSSSGSTWLRDRTSENLVHSLIMHCGGEALQFLNAAQDALCEWLSMRGLSISLSDLYLSDDPVTRKNLLDEISYGLREAETLSSISQMLIEDNQDFLTGAYLENEESFDFQVQKKMNWVGQNQASISSFKRGFRDIQSLFYVYASNENSLLAMLKAGSKGNLLKAVQHSMCLGLLHASCTLGFQIPYHLSSPSWNIPEHSGPHFPCAVVENSFLTGLNPLEGFVHSLVTREGSFGGNADVSGTLTRNLMFFMRDLYIGYDGTVRNKHGNHVVQFSYASKSFSQDVVGGHPVGSLAACALSEAAYSALDQPVSILEPSPLMNLKKVLESGAKRNIGGKTASLYLSKKLVKYCNGYEYSAWEVKRHLERMLFSDIVSTVLICFSPETCQKRRSPWLCHFHINNELAKRKGIKVQSIASGLSMHCADTKAKAKFEFPKLHITCTDCSLKKERDACISAAIDESSEESSPGYDTLRDVVKPFLLGTVIKGFSAFKKVDILWKEGPKGASGELCLQVSMSEKCVRTKFWPILVESCLPIMDLIDWQRSHPDDIQDISQTFGIDLAWNSFLNRLSSAMSDAEKDILPEHLALTTDCLSATGEFVALNAKGLADQRKAYSVSAPFSQACLKNPGPVFVKASKMGSVDLLQGSAEALSWGKVPSVGTGFQFEVLYSGEGHKLAEPTDVYSLLGIQSTLMKQNPVVDPTETIEIHRKSRGPKPRKYEDIDRERRENLLRKSISKAFSLDDIQKLSQALSNMLKAYRVDEPLKESDKSIVMKALYFHPQRDEKIGTGAREIKVGRHEKHQSPCLRSDGTVEDFSYRKCVHRALELIAPDKAKTYQSKWMKGKDLPVAATGQGGRLIQS
ncbi:unnamed protein product [Cuscuta campestris]|uniref:DNA-directed RNA polymerase n=1 Tax=Cuscuta campestris TaxID=132261 RepID=A0A484LLD4_9ASTE|nr:unnamed protein product [Cuscuta campestris]